MAHLGAVCTHARLPAVTCHELWEDDLLTERLEVVKGRIAVPEGPGLGVEIDLDAIRKYRVEPGTPTPKERYLAKDRTIRITIPREDGEPQVLEFPSEKAYYHRFLKGEFPGFVPGVRHEVIEGSKPEHPTDPPAER
jgi:galactonate dehydratase